MKIESRDMYRIVPHDNVVGRTKVINGEELIEMIYHSGDYEDMWQRAATELYGEEEDFDDRQMDEINDLAWEKYMDTKDFGRFINLGDYNAYEDDHEEYRVILYKDNERFSDKTVEVYPDHELTALRSREAMENFIEEMIEWDIIDDYDIY